ncbi:uncharacterized protein LOC121887483 [Tachysurus ichikawai]
MKQHEVNGFPDGTGVNLYRTVRNAFPSLKKKEVHTFINLVSAEDSKEYAARTVKETVNIPKHTVMKIQCQNGTDHDITLIGRTELGTLQAVKSVLPATTSQSAATASVTQAQNETISVDSNMDPWDPPVAI